MCQKLVRNLSEPYKRPIRRLPKAIRKPIRTLSEPYPKAYPKAYPNPIRTLSEPYPNPIRNLSETYPKPIRNLSETYQKPVRNQSKPIKHLSKPQSETYQERDRNLSEPARKLRKRYIRVYFGQTACARLLQNMFRYDAQLQPRLPHRSMCYRAMPLKLQKNVRATSQNLQDGRHEHPHFAPVNLVRNRHPNRP